MKLKEAIQQIEEFKELRSNWNGYGAEPFSEKLINKALSLVKQLKPTPEVFPTSRNSIQFEWQKGNNNSEREIYFELEIFEDRIEIFGDARIGWSRVEIGDT